MLNYHHACILQHAYACSMYYAIVYCAVPTSAPQNLSSSAISSSSFMLKWNEPPDEHQNGHITGYDVRVIAQEGRSSFMKLSTENSEILVFSVEESTTYFVSVAAKTSVGVGPYSEPISITTKKDQCMLYSMQIVLEPIVFFLLQYWQQFCIPLRPCFC